MKNAIFLTTRHGEYSGGTTIDKWFVETISSNSGSNIILLQDKDFSDKKLKWYSFLITYRRNLEKLTNYDVFITNSRLYPRLFPIINKIKYRNKKMIVLHHHFNYMTHKGIKKFIHKILEKYFLNKFDEVITFSPYNYDLCKKTIKPHLELFPVTIEKNQNFLVKEHNHNLLFIGNIEKRKGIMYGLEAIKVIAKKYPDVKYNIVGSVKDIEYKKDLDKFIYKNDLTGNICFHGRLADDNLIKLLADCSIFVFPSLYEGFGMVILEAMKYSMPIVAFDNSAMYLNVVDGVNGFLVENTNSFKLADKIELLFQNKDLYMNLSKSAFNHFIESPNGEEVSLQIKRFWDKMIK